MPRGRQYYDPIIQVSGKVEGAQDMSRIELYPEGAPDDPNPKWRGRRIAADGAVVDVAPGDFDHDQALAQAQDMWPELTVYELRSEGEDSTWEGHGPSPRLWQGNLSPLVTNPPDGPFVTQYKDGIHTGQEVPPAVEVAPQPTGEQAPLHLLVAPESGAYVLLSDILRLLEMWAVSYEVDKNPSGALALREAVDTLKDIG